MSLVHEIAAAESATPSLWWLGHNGFAIKNRSTTFYIDVRLSDASALIAPHEVDHADLLLCSSASQHCFDRQAVGQILERSDRAKLVLPKSAAEEAHNAGIDYSRMTTTDSGLRVEFFKGGEYARIYSVPAASSYGIDAPELQWSAIGGHPHLCFLIRFATCTIFHYGGTLLYQGLAERLKPYNVTVALIPIRESISAFAQLAADIDARWVIPIDSDPERIDKFTEHMLGHHPEQRFKLMSVGESWTVPG